MFVLVNEWMDEWMAGMDGWFGYKWVNTSQQALLYMPSTVHNTFHTLSQWFSKIYFLFKQNLIENTIYDPDKTYTKSQKKTVVDDQPLLPIQSLVSYLIIFYQHY